MLTARPMTQIIPVFMALREVKIRWWQEKAKELQTAADKRDMKAIYTGLSEIYGPKPRGLIQLYRCDGSIVIKEKDEILERLLDNFNQLLNVPGDLEKTAKDRITQRPVLPLLDDPPDMDELMSAL